MGPRVSLIFLFIQRRVGDDIADLCACWELARKCSLGVCRGLSAVGDLPTALEDGKQRRQRIASPCRFRFGFVATSERWRLEVRRRLRSETQIARLGGMCSSLLWALCGIYGCASLLTNVITNKANPCACTSVCLRTGHTQYTNRCALMCTAEKMLSNAQCTNTHSHSTQTHVHSMWWRHTGLLCYL